MIDDINYGLVSVVMSTYNEKIGYIRNSVMSILSQSYQNIEFIVIVDNPERQDIIDYLLGLTDRRLRVYINEHNYGIVRSLNFGINLCTGKYIARMDADDVSDEHRIEKQIQYLNNFGFDLIGCEVNIIDTNDIFLKRLKAPTNYQILNRVLKIENCLAHPSWFAKRKIYEDLKCYRNIYGCEDYDFLLRAIKKGYKIGCLNLPLLNYRINNNGITQSSYSEQYLNSRFIKKSLSIDAFNHYLNSNQYRIDLIMHKKFILLKNKYKSNKINFKFLIKLCFNKYLYISLYDKLKVYTIKNFN